MDEELILDACDLLEDDLKAKTFLALNVKLRKKWLLRKLRPHTSKVQRRIHSQRKEGIFPESKLA
ncbi:unnamed protein product [Brassica rapa]|uniref:Uncharacterized protein n=1 Tax=Brassica campestris TaxID=3711 RepID=A0A8D9M0U4_BRACM|nr:unnamed protein product [Brassica rapa]